jgi:hypothetical protein
MSRRLILTVMAAAATALVAPAAAGAAASRCGSLTVAAGQTYVVPQTTCLRRLTVESGATLAAPSGYSLSLTVNGVETGSELASAKATDTTIAPGTYRGRLVLTVAEANPVNFFGVTFPFRQALYVGAGRVDPAKSVLAAVTGGRVTDTRAEDITIRSAGQAFNGVYVDNAVSRSGRFGVMWHGGGQPNVNGGTVTIGGRADVRTDQTTFLDKGLQVGVNVDGSQGARVRTGNGVLFQMMDTDDPGPQLVDGQVLNTGVYHEPTGEPVKDTAFDPTTAHPDDAVANLAHIRLDGDVFNGLRGSATSGRNVVLNLDDAQLRGVLSASRTDHAISTITSADCKQLGEVTNTASPVINNGMIVNLGSGSRWTVTGTSYLSRLAVAEDAAVTAPAGRAVSMTVNGVATPIVAGRTYTGAITVSVGLVAAR